MIVRNHAISGHVIAEAGKALMTKEPMTPHSQTQKLFPGAKILPVRGISERHVPDLHGLEYHSAFIWIWENGGRVLGHIDREEGMWSLSVPLHHFNPTGLWIDHTYWESKPCVGILMNGGREWHSRPKFKGYHAHLVLSYREK